MKSKNVQFRKSGLCLEGQNQCIEEILFCTLILAPEYCANIHFSFFYCAIFAFLAETVYGYWLLVLILCCFYKTVIVSLKYSNLFFNVDI